MAATRESLEDVGDVDEVPEDTSAPFATRCR
jgi:hypothetical protein